ncbi:ASST-domain-containing protein [Xylogone sp. PMI_703]|nr:ASST-domain-containing protein [Xylogone sp. PMI_703]
MASTWRSYLAAFLFTFTQMVNGWGDIPMLKHHTDLTNFVSEPDIKAPLFNITHYDEKAVSPGYWFIDPYDNLYMERKVTTMASLFQIGAHIYDNRGELVWSGAPLFDNRASFDFKPVQINGTTYLSLIINKHDLIRDPDMKGAGLILDSHYTVQQKVHDVSASSAFNMHEFNIVEDGRTALIITWIPRWNNLDPDLEHGRWAWTVDNGFREVDLQTNKVLFDWHPLDHIDVSASKETARGDSSAQNPWDWIHLNSVDKNKDGDYLVSGRHTSAIYKISGRDGSIIWQLGGVNSSFVHENDFAFSFQHDARFREENNTHTIISFLDNASKGQKDTATANVSSILYVALRTDISPMTATVIAKIERPDGKLTQLRGSVQELPNKNIFVCWSDYGYINEFTPSGELVLEARFMTGRFAAYRSRKFNFTGSPLYPPALKAYAFGTTNDTVTNTFYVSWNGATEVAEWRFYGTGIGEPDFHLVGSAKKKGFETSYMSAGYQKHVYAEALDAKGNSLGRSEVFETIVPSGWEYSSCSQGLCQIPEVSTPLLGYTPEQKEQVGQDDNTSISNERCDDYSTGNIMLIVLAVCEGLVIIFLTFAFWWWRRSQLSTTHTKYEKVMSKESSIDNRSLDEDSLDSA